ncbi:MAG: UDP-glucose dehydrogenase family protein [Bacteroidota bacterium]
MDEEKNEKLKHGVCPIFEPGLDRLLERNIKEERLYFTTNLEEAVLKSDIVFLCLPTPPNEDGSADLNHVLHVAGNIAAIYKENGINDNKIIVNKSTVPVGTSAKVKEIFNKNLPGNKIDVVSNPEFLREGFAVEDALKPERVVIGTSSEYAADIMKDLYHPFVRSGNPIIIMDEKSSELTKYAANSFLATKISFMNDLSAYCDKVGADIEKIRYGIGSDTRIGKRFLFAGIGYGGSCFPKDVKALIYSAHEEGLNLRIIEAAKNVNDTQIKRFYENVKLRFNYNLKGVHISLWGLSFKPNTDDTRDAPAFALIEMLLADGAIIKAYDPEAMPNTRKYFNDKIKYAKNMYDCANGADALIISTEWTVFRNPDFAQLKELMNNPIIFDGRNLYEPEDMKEEKFEYYCVGRGRPGK